MKKIYLLLFLGLISYASYGTATLGNSGLGAVPAGTICIANPNYIIQEFTIAQTAPSTHLFFLQFTTTGTYGGADVSNFYLYASTTPVMPAIPISTIAGAGPGTHNFFIGGGGYNMPAGATYYYWITANVPGTATVGKTIAVNSITSGNIFVTTGATANSCAAGGLQTIDKAPTGVTASVAPNPVCENASFTLTGTASAATYTTYAWTGPTGAISVSLNPAPFTATTGDAGIYTLTATNVCGSTSASSAILTVNPQPAAIGGPTFLCLGTSGTLTESTGAGTWLSTVPGVAPITSGGVITGNATGTTTIIFTLSTTGCQVSTLVTVSTSLPLISGSMLFCQYTASTLSDITTGGTWSESNGIASIDPVTGVSIGLQGGMDTITYTSSGCNTTTVITVSPVPAPGAVTGVSNICIGGTTILTDTPAGGAWVSGNPLVASIDLAGNVMGISAGSAVMTYNLTNSCGTTGATFIINVERPVAAVTGPFSFVCIYNGLPLYDSIAGGIWTPSNANATVDSFSGLVIGAAVGWDTISYTLANACGTSVATYIVTVGMPADWGVISGPSIVCKGSTITMSETVTGGFWASNPGVASIDTSGRVTGVAQGVDTIFYVVMAPCGQSHAIDIIRVDTFGTPFVTITANPGITSCESVPVTYTANPSFGGTAPAYLWKVNSAYVGSSNTYTYVPANGDIITIGMTSDYPCATTPTAGNFVITNVIPLVVPTIKVVAGTLGDTICAGTLDSFIAKTTNGGMTPAFQWSVNGINMATGPIDSLLMYTPNNGDLITCKITSNAVCPIPDSALSSVTMTVNTTELPAVTVSVNPSDSVCSGALVTYAAHYSYGGRAPSFLWIKNGASVATGDMYSYHASNYDTISCEFFSSASCAVPATVLSNKILMHTGPVVYPVVHLAATPGKIVPYGHNDTITASVSGAGSYPNYQWIVNGVVIAGATSSTYVLNYVAGANIVSCLVTGSGNCPIAETMVSDTINIISSGIKQISTGTDELVLAPNPNNGIFTLAGITENDGILAIEITDIVGKVVYRDAMVATNGIINKQINLQNGLVNGFYLLHVISGNDNKVIRFTLNK